MEDLVKLWEKPTAKETYMLAGWYQWADAGAVSSGLPEYLIQHLGARKIGDIEENGFYLFQIPGTHHLLRPEVKFDEGYSEGIRPRSNEVFYAGDEDKGLVIFLGEEPHLHEARYANAFFQVAEALEVRQVAIVGGVYGALPYDKARDVSCTYSLPEMKQELARYAVKFSNYEGGATIGSYLVSLAGPRRLPLFVFNAFVPAYDFSEPTAMVQGLRIENDHCAWYELMLRLNHMLGLGIDLSDLEQKSKELVASMDAKVAELDRQIPHLQVRKYLDELASEFDENPFMPLGDWWERELGDIFKDLEE